MSSPALPLSDIVNVIVLVTPQTPTNPTFNQGLIVGPTAVIPAAQRVRQYTQLTAMLTDGFTTSSPEYIAAAMYFSQSPPPQILQVGRQDLTSVVLTTLNAGGTGYQVGNVLTIVQGGGSGATIQVTAVSAGVITAYTLLTPGTGYATANGLATTGGNGINATINITGIGDTPLAAVTACRLANASWWACMVTGSVKADHQAIAAYANAVTPPMCYFYATQDADALSGATGNVFAYMKTNSYNRAFGIYSTTQGGVYPNDIYAAASAMGIAMGLNTWLANSAFTMKFKTAVGVAQEPLSETQIGVIQGNNGNLMLDYANAYNFITQGVVGNGQFLDEILNLDMLVSQIQYNIMNLFITTPKVPQTDAGETQLIQAVNQAAEAARQRGFIGPGVWTGVTLVNLTAGTSLPSGYLAQAFPYATQLIGDRQARKAMPIYLAIIEAGAAHSITIGVYVQR